MIARNEQLLPEDAVSVRNAHSGWYLWAQGDLHLTQETPTKLTVQQPKLQPNSGWTFTVPETAGPEHLQVSDEDGRTLKLGKRASVFRVYPTIEHVYFIDAATAPCYFLTLANTSDPWSAHVRLNNAYPPSALAHWDLSSMVKRNYGT